jgi:hypothetical protein
MTINYDIQQLIFELNTVIGEELTLHSKRHISCINAVNALRELARANYSDEQKLKGYNNIYKQVKQYL